MSVTVCKFGGSSVCDARMFLRVRDIVLSSPDRKYIVLSAPGRRTPDDEKITDLLYRAYGCGGAGDQFIFAQIFHRYASIRDRLVPSFDLETEFARMRSISPACADYMASRGEYLCAKLFAAFMDLPFVDAADLFVFSGDGIDFEATCRRVQMKLQGIERAVIPGFYGASENCGIKTFSRGGSDVSGAVLAAALQADRYENWTDVDGLFTADPNIVPDARRSRLVSLDQMERIARCGANLLHPDALLPIRGTGIETVIKNTFAPDDPGTRIVDADLPAVPCVTGMRGMYLLPHADDADASSALLHPTPAAGARRVACVNVFGLALEHTDALHAEIKPIDIIHMHDHMQIIIEEADYAGTVRKIHSILMKCRA